MDEKKGGVLGLYVVDDVCFTNAGQRNQEGSFGFVAAFLKVGYQIFSSLVVVNFGGGQGKIIPM